MPEPVFVELQTDAFAENFERYAFRPAMGDVRRPVRGFEIKEDTYGMIKVIKADGTMIPLTDAAGPISASSGSQSGAGSGVPQQSAPKPRTGGTYNYSNFIIQSISESRQEKAQVLETFGDTFVFFFGERPRILQVSGILMNTLDFNWRTEFWYNYENILRGTKLVEQNARIYLFYDDLVVEGYMLGANAQDDAQNPYHIPFNFQLFITNHQYLGAIGQEDYPITHAVNLKPLLTATEVMEAKNILKSLGIQVQKSNTLTGSLLDSFAAMTSGGLTVKAPLIEGVSLGIQSAATMFLDVAKTFFGMSIPSRLMPYRTKLRDNVDERMNNYEWGHITEDRVTKAVLEQQYSSMFAVGGAVVADLVGAGINAIFPGEGCPLLDASHMLMASSSPTPVYNTFAIRTTGYGA